MSRNRRAWDLSADLDAFAMTVNFVAYIDESGDTGLEAVKPHDPGGASEWLVLGCLLVRAQNEPKLMSWVSDIQGQFKSKRRDLHFNKLLDFKKTIACQTLATKPCICFTVMSNKKNIERYRNPNLDADNKAWIYWWLTRLLLERVTDFCEKRVSESERGKQKLGIIFSRRGGLLYRDFIDYLWKLKWQSGTGTMFIDYKDLAWSVIDFDQILVLDHPAKAGLQLADVVAGAFFQAVERNRPADCDPQYAKLLKPKMARNERGNVLSYGIKTMPQPREMGLSVEQREIFEFYGHPKKRWEVKEGG